MKEKKIYKLKGEPKAFNIYRPPPPKKIKIKERTRV